VCIQLLLYFLESLSDCFESCVFSKYMIVAKGCTDFVRNVYNKYVNISLPASYLVSDFV